MFSTFICTEITISSVLSICTHSTDTHSRTHVESDAARNLLPELQLPREFISKIVLQLKSYMTFLSSEVLEAVQLKDSLLETAAEHC